MPRRRVWSSIKQKLPRVPGYNRARESDRQRQDRSLVLRRGSYRPEEQDHPPVGEARHPPERSAGSAHRLDLHLRCHLPETGQGRSPDLARTQHRGDEPAPRGDRPDGRTRSPRRPPRRSGWMASVRKIGHSHQQQHPPMPPKSPELNPVENIWLSRPAGKSSQAGVVRALRAGSLSRSFGQPEMQITPAFQARAMERRAMSFAANAVVLAGTPSSNRECCR